MLSYLTKQLLLFAFLTLSIQLYANSPTTDQLSKKTKNPRLQGGKTTQIHAKGAQAFSLPAANLSFEQRGEFALGNAMFRRVWVSSPSSTKSTDGLGPLFNARSCQRCHIKDGRGHLPKSNYPDAVSYTHLTLPTIYSV